MEKIDMLVMRACKTHDPYKRLKTIYKKFYLSDNGEEGALFLISKFVDEFAPMKISDFINGINNAKNIDKLFKEETSDFKINIMVLVGHVNFKSNRDTFKVLGVPLPLRWKVCVK